MKKFILTLFATFLLLISIVPTVAQETNIMIRVQSKDAKFIGSSIGGAQIIVKDDLTGKILAEGITKGSTGDTPMIMEQPISRGKSITNEETAGFLARLDIQEPVFVTIEQLPRLTRNKPGCAHLHSNGLFREKI